MEQNASKDVKYYLLLDKIYEDSLASIRHWKNLSIAYDDDDNVWVKGLSEQEMHSKEILSIPNCKRYCAKGPKLYPLGKLLAERILPSLLWSTMKAALSLTKGKVNLTETDVNDSIEQKVVASTTTEKEYAVLLKLEELKRSAPLFSDIRLQHLQWAMIEDGYVLVIGEEIPPFKGEYFWLSKLFLIPLGYTMQYPFLNDFLNQRINEGNTNWVLWNADSFYTLLPKNKFVDLSIASINSTLKSFQKDK